MTFHLVIMYQLEFGMISNSIFCGHLSFIFASVGFLITFCILPSYFFGEANQNCRIVATHTYSVLRGPERWGATSESVALSS